MTESRVDIVEVGPPDVDDSGWAHAVLCSDGMTSEARGSLLGGTRLSTELGLTLVHASDDSFRWERRLGTGPIRVSVRLRRDRKT